MTSVYGYMWLFGWAYAVRFFDKVMSNMTHYSINQAGGKFTIANKLKMRIYSTFHPHCDPRLRFLIISHVYFLLSLCQNPAVHPSPSERPSGCFGVWCSTTLFQCRIPKAPPVRSWCQCGPFSLSSSWLPTLPTWQPSWSRRSMWTRCRACQTKRWERTLGEGVSGVPEQNRNVLQVEIMTSLEEEVMCVSLVIAFIFHWKFSF